MGDKFAFDKMFSDNAPVAVVTFGGEYYCVTEAPFLHKIDPTTLETISKVRLGANTCGVGATSSHRYKCLIYISSSFLDIQ